MKSKLKDKIINLIEDLNEVQLQVIDEAIKTVMPKIDKLYLQQEPNKKSNSVEYKKMVADYIEGGEWDNFY